jgi:hypothetical protein
LFDFASEPQPRKAQETWMQCEWDPSKHEFRDVSNWKPGPTDCERVATIALGRPGNDWAYICEDCAKDPKMKCFAKSPILYVKELREVLAKRKDMKIRRAPKVYEGDDEDVTLN